MKKRIFPENEYVDLQDIPLDKKSGFVFRGWKKYVARGALVVIFILFVGALLLFLLLSPQRASGSSDSQLWSPEQEGMIKGLCEFIETSIAREAGVYNVDIFFNIPGKADQKRGVSITFRNGNSEVMEVIKNVPPPLKKQKKGTIVIG